MKDLYSDQKLKDELKWEFNNKLSPTKASILSQWVKEWIIFLNFFLKTAKNLIFF